MKKMIIAMSILAVSATMLMASAGAVSKVTQSKAAVSKSLLPTITDMDVSVPSTRDISGWTASASTGYAGHFFGYGWYLGPQKKVAFDPSSGVLGSCFRMGDSEGGTDLTGTIGGMSTRSEGLNDAWKDWIDTAPLSRQSAVVDSKFSGRYPSVVACDGYLFGLYNNTIPDGGNSSAVFSVYSKVDESWSERINISNPAGTLSNGWCPLGDVVKDAEGYYHLLVTYEIDLTTKKDFCVITGKTKTPMVANSWVWSNYNDFKFGTTLSGLKQCPGVSVAWGQNGFGIIVTSATRETDTHSQVSYAYTTDYGQKWIRNESDVSTVKLFDVPEPCEFLGMADTLLAGEPNIKNFIMYHPDVTVGANNAVHIAGRVFRGATDPITSYKPAIGYCSSNNYPVNGILYIRGDFNGTDIKWAPGKVVAEAIGGRETDVKAPEGASADVNNDYATDDQGSVHLGTTPDGMVYIGYLDRPANARHINEFPIVVTDSDTRTVWMADGYMIYNDGTKWHHGEPATQRGFNLTNTRDYSEGGFSVSAKGKKHSASSVELYAGYQVWQPDMPHHPSSDKVNDIAEFQQKYFAMQINASSVGIETSAISLDKNFVLEQNYPNPFNPTTAINFNLKNNSIVKLTVFNAKGEIVSNLINAKMDKGVHAANFNAANLNSGVYFYKLTVDGQSAVKKMVLTK